MYVVELRALVVETQRDALVLLVGVGLDVVADEAHVLRYVRRRADDIAVAPHVRPVVVPVDGEDTVRHRIRLVVVDKARGIGFVLAEAAPRIGDVDVFFRRQAEVSEDLQPRLY